MIRMIIATRFLVAVTVTLFLAGCGSTAPDTSSSAPQDTTTSAASADQHTEHADHQHGEHAHPGNAQTDMEKMKAELAKLSPEDAASAERQHVCPVSGEMLGVMGAPKKLEVKGQQVWICCDNCKDAMLSNPDEYLAKLRND